MEPDKMIEAVIFDMDGLLIDSEPLWHESFIEVFAKYEQNMNEKMCRETTGLKTIEACAYWIKKFDLDVNLTNDIERNIIQLVDEKIIEKGTLKIGVVDAIQVTKSLDIPIGLATSSNLSLVNTVFEKFSLKKYFSTISSAEKHPLGKPHPDVYLAAANQLKVNSTECLAIEDSINGLLAAKAARMNTIAVPENHSEQDKRFSISNFILHSLEEFEPKFLKKSIYQKN